MTGQSLPKRLGATHCVCSALKKNKIDNTTSKRLYGCTYIVHAGSRSSFSIPLRCSNGINRPDNNLLALKKTLALFHLLSYDKIYSRHKIFSL